MQDVVRHIPAVIYEYAISPDGEGFTFVSENSDSILGLNAAALMRDYTLLYSIVIKEDISALRRMMSDKDKIRTNWSWKGRILVEQRIKWVWLTSKDEVDENGVLLRRGIIQFLHAEDRPTNEYSGDYENLLDKLPIGVVIHSQGKVLFANSHAHCILGARKTGDLIGANALDFVHPEHRKDIEERIQDVAEGRSVPMVEEKFIRYDGEIVDVEAMAFPFVFREKPSIQVIFRDVTEKKKTEAQNKKNETLFTQLFQNLPMGVVRLDETGRVFQVNKSFTEMFGYEKDELRGKNLNDFIVPDELRNEGIDLNNLIASNQVVSIESIRKHRSGKLVNVILCGVPVMLDNQAIGIYGVYVDISDRKKIEEELKIRNTELDNFVYKVSHDLRAPLSSVLGLVNLSKLQGNTDNPLEYMGVIGEKIEALDHFIGDVLSHSKNLKMEISIGKVDLRKIIERTFTDLSYLEGAQNMDRIVKIVGIDFYSDQWRVSEIFRNLISNAIKYRQPAAKHSEISITVNIDHLRADIIFADNGIGIKETSLKRIFEMFYRATQQSDGSGIGLYIVKNAVEKLGGQINVASHLGEGTRFHILLPNINSIIKTSHLELNDDEDY